MTDIKYHPHGSVLFITTRIEQGKLFLCNSLCQLIIRSCMANAQKLYPVKICHYLFEATHLHLVLWVDNPDDVPAFMRYLKGQSATMINRVLGRRKRTVWCEGYKSPVVLDLRSAINSLAYIYANPAKDGLVATIDEYPGESSWEMYRSGRNGFEVPAISVSMIKELPKERQNKKGYDEEVKRLESQSWGVDSVTLYPDEWMPRYNIEGLERCERVNLRVVARVRQKERQAAAKRKREGRGEVMGRKRLENEPFDTTSFPNLQAKRVPQCYTFNKTERKLFKAEVAAARKRGREVLELWRSGDMSVRYPPGLYPPSAPKIANMLGSIASQRPVYATG